jgi:hypothetical protein
MILLLISCDRITDNTILTSNTIKIKIFDYQHLNT